MSLKVRLVSYANKGSGVSVGFGVGVGSAVGEGDGVAGSWLFNSVICLLKSFIVSLSSVACASKDLFFSFS